MAAISIRKIFVHIGATICGCLAAWMLSEGLNDKDVIGWLVGTFTAFSGLILAVITLAGHSLTLLQGEDWKSLQTFKKTYQSRILFCTVISFILILSVSLIILNYILKGAIDIACAYISGMSLAYIAILPFKLSNMYVEYYDFLIALNKKKQIHQSNK
ncbi:MAG: hypothetical protein F8N36_04865 [Desulfovibrio sp.]|uniref:hypothetical protein n=1 Tax=Desulfovibrio sp. TaxID=885 RepID=UPI00135DFB46|nr:hypothetical protein [Desulfovibrio sp.]MTJ92182.1 hypothetical protein [Desulfovibrio sp.]